MSEESPEDPALDATYRRLAALGASAPSEATRHAILAHAHSRAATRAVRGLRPRATSSWGRPALFGALAASIVAGLTVLPRWRTPPAPVTPAVARVQVTPADSAAAPTLQSQLSTPAPKLAPAPPVAALRRETLLPQAVTPALGSPRAAGEARLPAAAADARAANPATAAASRSSPVAGAPALPGALLRHAAETGDLAQLEALSRGQPDLNARDARGRTALMLATLNGHASAVAALLAYGADPEVADASGLTPLAAARAAGNTGIVAIFERYGLHEARSRANPH